MRTFNLPEIRRKQVERGVDFEPYRPRVLPANWSVVQEGYDGAAYQGDGLRVIYSVAKEADGVVWLHVSASRPSRVPSYDDLCLVKQLFIGPERHAYQCFVPSAEHVNINPHVLHLWARADGERCLPDFTAGTGTI